MQLFVVKDPKGLQLSGGVVMLTEEQYKDRAHAVKKHSGNAYAILTPIVFKAGEVIGYAEDLLSRAQVEKITPLAKVDEETSDALFLSVDGSHLPEADEEFSHHVDVPLGLDGLPLDGSHLPEAEDEDDVEQPSEQPSEQAAEQATEQPSEQAAEQATEQPSEQATEQAAEQPSEQAAKPAKQAKNKS